MIGLPSGYTGLQKAFTRYWADYGGWRDLLASPLLHFSSLIAATSYSAWLDPKWSELPLALLPNLLGFSLGAYALIFSLADANLLAALNAPTPNGSPTNLRMINATFLHFILVQTFAIIFALCNRSTLAVDLIAQTGLSPCSKITLSKLLIYTAGAFGYFLTIYAVVLLIGAALAAYRLAIMSGKAASLKVKKEQEEANLKSRALEQPGDR